MKANESKNKFVYPDKLYARTNNNITLDISYAPQTLEAVEYTRTYTFIERALKWYCLDCECNDNCKDTKCFFYREFERYLKGDEHAIPPKFETAILNPDGSTTENWRYRHFVAKMKDAFIEKAATWIANRYQANGSYLCADDIEDFRKYMEGE